MHKCTKLESVQIHAANAIVYIDLYVVKILLLRVRDGPLEK
jgi:hypothetical protein